MGLKSSLKSIRKGIVHRDRAFRTIRTLYTHLSELSNQEILDYYSVKNIKELEFHIENIKKILRNQIENYEEELEQLSGCFCIDSQGEFKYLYSTKKEAEQQANYILKTKRIKLTIYACPYHCGWHLSQA